MTIFHTILSNLQERLTTEAQHNDTLAVLIQTITHVPITPKDISIKRGVVALSLSPTAKMAVLMKKEEILLVCKEKGLKIGAIV